MDWLEEKGYAQGAVTVHQDNQSTMRLAKKGYGASSRTKHWNIRLFRVKETIDQGLVSIKYTRSEDMLADPLTKPVPRDTLKKWRETIGVIELHEAPTGST